jgi:predicted O-methyltransferase YrrM
MQQRVHASNLRLPEWVLRSPVGRNDLEPDRLGLLARLHVPSDTTPGRDQPDQRDTQTGRWHLRGVCVPVTPKIRPFRGDRFLMRTVEDCPFRCDVRGPGRHEVARCGLIEEILGASGPDRYLVHRDMCESCCDAPPPSVHSLNVATASLLVPLTIEVLAKGGEPGCDADKAARIQKWVFESLPKVHADHGEPLRTPREGPCFHRGHEIGLRDCSACEGSVRVKVFGCHHLLHQETTVAECRRCHDYEPPLAPRRLSTWAVGVVTAPREHPTLPRSLASLALAGWASVRLFAEPGCELPIESDQIKITRRADTLGEWPNWLLGLAELYQRGPRADAYMMVQDDTVFCRGVREFLEAELWPDDRVGMVSVYCPEPHAQSGRGWKPVAAGAGLVGALTCIFPNAAARALLGHPGIVDHRLRGGRHGLVDTDGIIGRWAQQAAMPVYHYSPSLAQHIGDTSTVWPGAPNAGPRRSSNFVGEDFDARELIVPHARAAERRLGRISSGAPAPLVSCIMPTADRRAFAQLALSYFLDQDYVSKELIVVDDGADSVGDLFEGLPGVSYVRLPDRSSIGEKRNIACRHARGELIAHWDDDDWYASGRLSQQVAPIVAGEADLTGLANMCVLALPDSFWTTNNDLHRRMFRGDVHGGTLVYRSSLIKDGLRYPDVDLAEDAWLLERALAAGKRLARLDNAGLFVYVRHDKNAWQFDPGSFLGPAGWVRIDRPASFPSTTLLRIQEAARQLERSPCEERSSDPPDLIDRVTSLLALPIDEAVVGYGALGKGGDLGYEGGRVSVGGQPSSLALSAHAPSRLAFSIGGKFATFRCGAAINDDVPAGRSRANFWVFGDGRALAQALRVTAGEPVRHIRADVRGIERLELVVDSDFCNYCHSVWLGPILDSTPPPDEGKLLDCLSRTEIRPPADIIRAERCVATVASPSFVGQLDDLLGSLVANGNCPGSAIVVFAVGPDAACYRVASKYGAIIVPCVQRTAIDPTVKSVLYSVARVVDANRFICLDADMLVLGDLSPLFDAIDACPDGSLFAVREGNGNYFADLEAVLCTAYAGQPADVVRLIGQPSDAGRYRFVCNDGLFAGGRTAMLALDSTIRGWTAPGAWVDENSEVRWRNQFVFNLVLAHLDCGVELDGSYNFQLNYADAEVRDDCGRTSASWRGKSIKVLHFNGMGRHKYPEHRGRYAAVAEPVTASGHGDAYAEFLAALRAWLGCRGRRSLAWSFYGTPDGQSAEVADSSTFPLFALLHNLIRANGVVRVIETGTARGVSTACIASAVAHRVGGRVVTIDFNLHDERDELWNCLPDRIRSCIEPRLTDSITGLGAALDAGESYEAALLDTEHTADHVWAEFQLAARLVCRGGLILIHDAVLEDATVDQALLRIEADGYGVTRLWTADRGHQEDQRLGLAVIENRRRSLA